MKKTIKDLFPENGRLVLTSEGKVFIKQLGENTTKGVILGVLCGENLRSQTEPLTRKRLSLVSGALFTMFVNGWSEYPNFTEIISKIALDDLKSVGLSKGDSWVAQWSIGLTGKSVENVVRGIKSGQETYIRDFENVIRQSAEQCLHDFGDLKMMLGFVENQDGKVKELGWEDVIRLATAIGSATLTIRGSEKSTFGKVFERLVLGAALTVLGFEYIENSNVPKIDKVFWLSDSSDERECDATIRIKAGKLARFDLGFIGKGNPEISKDKLSRYARVAERDGDTVASQTFIIVDKIPTTSKTRDLARRSDSEIIQMSMKFWLKELAVKLEERLGHTSEILNISEDQIHEYVSRKLQDVNILSFLKNGVSLDADDLDV